MKRRDFVAGSLFLASASHWPAASAETEESTWERVTRTKILRVAAVDGAQPYYKKDITTGKWLGFMSDFYRSLAKSLDAELNITTTSWGNSVMDLQSNNIDVFFGLNPTPARQEVVDFTDPILNIVFTAVCKKGFTPKSWADLDQPGIRVAVDKGSSHDALATRLLKNANVSRFETAIDATLALQVGRADAQILVLPLALSLVTKNPAIGQVITLTPEQLSTSNGGVRKESDSRWLKHINTWLAAERASGYIRKTFIANLISVGGVSEDKIPPELKV